jgi:hypothetical protein
MRVAASLLQHQLGKLKMWVGLRLLAPAGCGRPYPWRIIDIIDVLMSRQR